MPLYAIAILVVVDAPSAREAWEETSSAPEERGDHVHVSEPQYQSNCFPATEDMLRDPAWSIPRIEYQDQVLEPIPADQEDDR